MPRSYWQASDTGPLDSEDPISINSRLIDIDTEAVNYGFTGLFDAVLSMAKSDASAFQHSTQTFVQSGGLAELISACLGSPGSSDTLPESVGGVIADTSCQLYLREWRKLVSFPAFRRPLTTFAADYADDFSFLKIYQSMQSCAPSLIHLFGVLTGQATSTESTGNESSEQRRQRFVVTALCILARQQNQQFNVLQSFCTMFLFANNTPKQVVEVLNQIGISTSYTSLSRGLDSNAKYFRHRLRNVCQSETTNVIVLDNIQFKANVRDQRVTNQAGFITGTAGYVLLPAPDKTYPMFTPEDCRYELVRQLTVRNFLPTKADQDTIEEGFRSMIWHVVRSACKAQGVRPPRLKFPMPSVYPLDRRRSPEILPLPTYHLDEGIIDDLIEILYNVQKDIGLSDEQATSKTVPFRGDLLTTLQYR
jgi:hypothetical protein